MWSTFAVRLAMPERPRETRRDFLFLIETSFCEFPRMVAVSNTIAFSLSINDEIIYTPRIKNASATCGHTISMRLIAPTIANPQNTVTPSRSPP